MIPYLVNINWLVDSVESLDNNDMNVMLGEGKNLRSLLKYTYLVEDVWLRCKLCHDTDTILMTVDVTGLETLPRDQSQVRPTPTSILVQTRRPGSNWSGVSEAVWINISDWDTAHSKKTHHIQQAKLINGQRNYLYLKKSFKLLKAFIWQSWATKAMRHRSNLLECIGGQTTTIYTPQKSLLAK